MDDDHARRLDDAEILERVTENPDDYIHLLLAKYKDTIFAVALRMLGNQQDAEEVTLDTFEKFYRSLPKMIAEGQAIHLRPWLIRVVTNGCLNHKRHDGRKRRPPPGISLDTDEGWDLAEGAPRGQTPSAEDEAIQYENNEELYRLLRRLPERQRVIVILYYIGGLPDPEIASILGRKPDAIKRDRERALKKLRDKEGERVVTHSILMDGRGSVDFPRGTGGVDFPRGTGGVDFPRGTGGVDFPHGTGGVDFPHGTGGVDFPHGTGGVDPRPWN